MKILYSITLCVFIFQNTFSMEYTTGMLQQPVIKPYILIKNIKNKSNKPIRIEHQGNVILELGPRTTTKSLKQVFFTRNPQHKHIFSNTIEIINVNDLVNKIVFEADIDTVEKKTTYYTITNLYKIEDEIFSLPSAASVILYASNIYSLRIIIDDLSPEQIKAAVKFTPEKTGARQIEIEKE